MFSWLNFSGLESPPQNIELYYDIIFSDLCSVLIHTYIDKLFGQLGIHAT